MIGYEDKANLTGRSRSHPEVRHHYHRPGYHLAKRLMDIVVSGTALVILAPVYAVVALGVGLSTGWPTTFRQKRIGQNGDLFHIIKFRSMVKNAEEILKSRPDLMEEYRRNFKIENDPRISRFGSFLRKSSLDELPQLLNVLRGDMTLVGPRPIVPPEIEKYGESASVYLAMKPGCTGLWQCSGRSDTTYEERVALDREYYERASLGFDTKILFKTVVAIIRGRGAR